MKKSRFVRYLAYVTFILILFCVLPGGSLAAKDSSEHGNGVSYDGESVADSGNIDKDSVDGASTGSGNNNKDSVDGADTGSENSEKDSEEDINGTDNSNPEKVQDQDEVQINVQDRISAYKLERKQMQEELQLQKDEYQETKESFLEVRTQIRKGKLDPDSEEAVNATRLYLNSSVNYMMVYLKNVKTNMQYSNGNGTEERIATIDEDIKLLEAEQSGLANASSQQELLVTVRSVRGVWNTSQKTSLIGSGQTVSERIGEFLDKSDTISKKIEVVVNSLNETDTNKADLETRLTSYNLYLKAAHEKKEAADAIYEDEDATLENLGVANNYLRESLNNVNKANQILKVIFDDFKEYDLEELNGIRVENSTETELNNTISANNTDNNSSV